MLSQSLRQRLEQLNRAPIPQVSPPAVPSTASRLNAPVSQLPFNSKKLPLMPHAAPSRLSDGETVENSSGEHVRIVRQIELDWPGAEEGVARWRKVAESVDLHDGAIHSELAALGAALGGDALFLDLETCGLAGSRIFLIGLLHVVDGRMSVEQFFARDYRQERAILESLWRRAAERKVLATFNGKSFDWPMVHDRTTFHRFPPLADRPVLVHCDLLHHARRQWKTRLPNCRLQTLERFLCGRTRRDDVPGSEIPAVYSHFVKTGDSSRIDAVLHHNALDLTTLAQIAVHLLRLQPWSRKADASAA